jgi:DNA ligase-1
VVGAYYGRGKRSGGYGALLCAVYNNKNDTFETLCKLGTGLTDEMLEMLPAKLDRYKVERKPGRVVIKKEMEPDVWFEPRIVVEVLAAEITKSPFHTAGSGLALRFPRFVKLRDDKKAEQATTSEEIEWMARKK